ncbi:MAG: hypothetical protein L0G23_06635, partial [Ruaniaceae bacterium]|nr:hypothetical protein [Ruaniaceae bacterium]
NNVLVSLVLLVVLLAAAAAAVIGVVALFGKGKPRWISWVTIGVGLTVLIGTLSFWQGVATLP